MDDELSVLVDQLDELLGEAVVYPDDALEVAALAGMAQRLGATPEQLERAEWWRRGPGEELLEIAWDDFESEDILDRVEAVMGGDATDEEVEEALFDLDEIVAAAVWSGRTTLVFNLCTAAEATIRAVPDVFATAADFADGVVASAHAQAHPELYGWWRAVAEARVWLDEA